MRVLTGLLLLGAAFTAAPSAAQAADPPPMCDFSSGGDHAYQLRLGPFLGRTTSAVTPGSGVAPVTSGGEADDAAHAVLGAQFMGIWADTPRQGWSVAFSPGALDATTARAAIDAYLTPRVSAADKDYLLGALTLLPTPYSRAELDPIAAALLPTVLDVNGIFSGVGVNCGRSDGFRVELSVTPVETPEVRAQVDALVGQYGDKVRVRFGVPRAEPAKAVPGIGTPPVSPPSLKPPLRVRDHVSLPATARCVRGGTLTVKATGRQVQKLRLVAGNRTAFGKWGKPAKLKLKSRRTTVAVTVTLSGGGTATQTVTYRRCA